MVGDREVFVLWNGLSAVVPTCKNIVLVRVIRPCPSISTVGGHWSVQTQDPTGRDPASQIWEVCAEELWRFTALALLADV
jgi:hypothetical protein